MMPIHFPSFFVVLVIIPRIIAQNPPDLTPVTVLPPPNHAPLILVKDGHPHAHIQQSPQAGRLTSEAVNELIQCVRLTSGAKLSLNADSSSPISIVIGDCPQAAAIGLRGNQMPPEGFHIKTTPQAIFIVGNGDPGTAWGVYDFIERFLNVRFYWPGDLGRSVLPSPTIIIPPVHIADQPVFRKRSIGPSGGPRVNRDTGPHHRRLRAYDSWPIRLIVHAPHDWTKYRRNRPQIFQMLPNGERNFKMLCYGHPLTLKTYLEEIERQKQMAPEKIPRAERILRDNTITVSPADMAVNCACPFCRKLLDPHAGPYGSASRLLATFVRNLAQHVKKRWPQMTIIYLPYKNYTYAPSDITFPGNVEVQVCGMPGMALYKDPMIANREQKNIDAWIAITGRKIQNWHYSCWPADRTSAVYQYPHTVKQFYLRNRNKTVGTFINGVKDHWPRQNFTLYTWLKVLWNPNFDIDAALQAYCRRMFGPAAQTMSKLLRMQIDCWEKTVWKHHQLSPGSVYHESFPPQKVLIMHRLFEQARQQLQSDPVLNARINYLAGPFEKFFAEAELVTTRGHTNSLDAYQIPRLPKIDGILDEPYWRNAPSRQFILARQPGKKPKFPTTVRCLWTDQHIIFAFSMIEPEPEKLARKYPSSSRDGSSIWWDDNVEIFLDVTGERNEYYHFIINANGAVWDSYREDTTWNCHAIRTGIHIEQNQWSLEVCIPYQAFKKYTPPGTANHWYVNLTRHRVTDRTQREYQRLNCNGSPRSDDQNAFIPLRFIEQ